MRRTSIFAACAALIMALVAGCSSAAAPPATPPATVPASVVQGISDELMLKSLKGEELVQFGEFAVGDQHLIVAGMDGAQPFVAADEMARAATIYGGVTSNQFPVKLTETELPLYYNVALNTEPEHVVVFSPNVAAVDALGKENGQALSSSHTAWSAHSVDGKGTYVLTVIGDQPGLPTYGISQVPINSAATYVELCQSMLNVTLSPESLADLKTLPEWSDDPAVNGPQLAVARQAGQEVVCNSLGLAMAFSKLGVSYTTYAQIANAARLNLMAPLSMPLIVFSQPGYADLAK